MLGCDVVGADDGDMLGCDVVGPASSLAEALRLGQISYGEASVL